MPPTDPADTLRRYASSRSEEAFRALVEHYLPLVHASALRKTRGNSTLAREVAQDVFLSLAKKAETLEGRATLAPWLLRATHLAALQRVRSEQRRIEREQRAWMVERDERHVAEADWTAVRPLLDRLLNELGPQDQEAILLRFFEGLTFAEIGTRLGLGEDAARQRSNRALEKLRTQLSRRGIRSSAAILAQALGTLYGGNYAAGFSTSIATAALAGSVTGGGTATLFLILPCMNASKIAVGTLSLLAIAGIGGTFYNGQRYDRAEAKARSLADEQRTLREETQTLRARLQVSTAGGAGELATHQISSPTGISAAAPATALKTSADTRRATPPTSIEELLAQIDHVLANPGLRPAFVHQIVQQLWSDDQRFFTMERIPPDKVEAIKAEAAAYANTLLEARARRIGGDTFSELFAAADNHSLAQVERILGSDTFLRLREYKSHANENRLVDQLAARMYHTATPLTGEHAKELTALLVQARFSAERAGAHQTIDGTAISNTEHAAFRSAQTSPRVALITDAAIAEARARGKLPAATIAALQNLQAGQSAQLQLARFAPERR